jgi:hypothetical protein
MVIDPVEEVVHAVTVRDNAENTAHSELLLVWVGEFAIV